MKATANLVLVAFATFASVSATIIKGPNTIVLKEVNGVPGNECITFRNNGEMVDAACVINSTDRQVTPSTTDTGASVLFIERTFGAGFRDDLIGKEPCVGFNGTDFLAEDCDAAATQFVSLVGNELKAGQACDSGHDALAQLTVDPTGATCATFTIIDAATGATLSSVSPASPVGTVSPVSSASPVSTIVSIVPVSPVSTVSTGRPCRHRRCRNGARDMGNGF